MADLSASVSTGADTRQKAFDRVFSNEQFKGFRAIMDHVCPDRERLCETVHQAASFDDLLGRLGYRINWVKQIHVQDSYSRVGPAGGIKAVLPCFDIPTHSSLPTLIHYDSTITSTLRSAEFFNKVLAALKKQLSAQ